MSKKKTFLSSFRTRSFRVGGYSVVATAIVLAIIIAANVLIGALPAAVTELDITAEGLYAVDVQGIKEVEIVNGGNAGDVTVFGVVVS